MIGLLICLGAQAQVGSVRVELSLDKDQYIPDEDVVVSVKIYNFSGQQVVFGTEDDWITFSIIGDDNKRVAEIGHLPAKGEFTLRPSEMGTKLLNITPYYAFNKVGRYSLTATVKIPQWNMKISPPKAVFISVMDGVAIPNFSDMEFGVPPAKGVTNATPELRRYSLQKTISRNNIKLYFRLSDAQGHAIRVFPIGRMVSFSQPEARIDSASNLHILNQYGAKSFYYVVISPDGNLLVRQIHDFTQTRPTLRIDSEGRVYVGGGVRRSTPDDIPAPTPTVIPESTNNVSNP